MSVKRNSKRHSERVVASAALRVERACEVLDDVQVSEKWRKSFSVRNYTSLTEQ